MQKSLNFPDADRAKVFEGSNKDDNLFSWRHKYCTIFLVYFWRERGLRMVSIKIE